MDILMSLTLEISKPGMGPMQLLYIHVCVPQSIHLKLFGYNCVCAVVVLLIVGWRVFKGLINEGKNEFKKILNFTVHVYKDKYNNTSAYNNSKLIPTTMIGDKGMYS